MTNQPILQCSEAIRTVSPSKQAYYLSAWLAKNEHQSFSLLIETMLEKGYTKEEINLAIKEYMISPEII